jgi:hypothetical protein
LLCVGTGLVTTAFLLAERKHFPFPWAMVSVAGTLMMLAAVVLKPAASRSRLHRVLEWPALVYLGRLSFSLYLWHWPVAVLLRWTLGMELAAVQVAYPLVVLALGAASYHWVEAPFRAGGAAWRQSAWGTLAVGIAASGLLSGAALWLTQNAERFSLSQVSDSYLWHAYKHVPQEPLQKIDAEGLASRQLFVLGDSHAAAYRTMLNIVALKLGVTVIEYEQGGCGVARLTDGDPPDCAAFRETALEAIEARAKPGDIVFLASLRMPELAGREWLQDEAAAFAQTLAELTPDSIERAHRSAKDLLTRLQASGVSVLIDAPKPLFKAPPNRCSDAFNRLNPVCAPGLTVARDQLEQLRAPQMALLAVLQRDYRELQVWDPLPSLCPGVICSAYDQDGKPLFNDDNHLSGHGNRMLEPSFSQKLLSIWR